MPVGYEYRLPTEAEWEYACRAGTTTPFHYGDELHSGMANFAGIWGYDAAVGYVPDAEGIFLERTTPVGSYEPNGWGLCDVVGNVWEWCWDSYRDSLPGRSMFDPRIGTPGPDRIYRGGAWGSTGVGCRSAARGQFRATILLEEMGFRVVLGVLAGVAFVPIVAEDQAPSEGNLALVVFLVAVGLTLLLTAGLAALMWVLSLRSSHAAMGAAPKTAPKKSEELPEGMHLPSPSIQPLITAIGMTITVFGIVFRGFAIPLAEDFNIPITMVLGLIVTLAGMIGWVREGRKAAAH